MQAYNTNVVDRTRQIANMQLDIARKEQQLYKGNGPHIEVQALDDVKIHQQGNNAATVRLVKHFKVTPDGTRVPEWFIPARLQLKRVDGAWRIVGESDLGWVTSMDDWQ